MKPFNRELAEARHPIAFAKPEHWSGCSDLRFEKCVERAEESFRVVVSYKTGFGNIGVNTLSESAFVMAPKKRKFWVRAYRSSSGFIGFDCRPSNNRYRLDGGNWISDPVEMEITE